MCSCRPAEVGDSCRMDRSAPPRTQCHRFSAFWLRSKCSICSYQLNIWYGSHVFPSILIWFLTGDGDLGLALALSQVSLVLQYHQDGPLPHWRPGSHARQVTSVVLFILFLEILPRKECVFVVCREKKVIKVQTFYLDLSDSQLWFDIRGVSKVSAVPQTYCISASILNLTLRIDHKK